MKITADTNVLVRALTGDDARQSKAAQAVLKDAEVVAVALPALCELVWVLAQGYKVPFRRSSDCWRRSARVTTCGLVAAGAARLH